MRIVQIITGLVFALCFALIGVRTAMCQESPVVRFPKDFSLPEGQRIPYGEKILLTGTLDSTEVYSQVKVYTITLTGTDSVEGNISGNRWSAIVGSFPVKQHILFQFKTVSTLSPDQVKKLMRVLIDSLAGVVRSKTFEGTEEDYRSMLGEILDNTELTKFKASDNKSLSTLVKEQFANIDISDLVNVTSNNYSLLETKSKNIQAYLVTIKSQTATENYQKIVKKAESEGKQDLSKILNSIKDSTATSLKKNVYALALTNSLGTLSEEATKEFVNTFQKEVNQLVILDGERIKIENEQNKYIDTINLEILKKPLQEIKQYTSDNIGETPAITGDITHYIGFDMAEMLTPNVSVGTYLVFNLYTKRVELDSDPVDFFDRVALNAGIGLLTSDAGNVGPAYYLGAGVRVNKIVRFNFGSAFFKKDDSDGKFVWKLGIGFGLNLNYVGELLKVFNAASKTGSPSQ